MSSYSLYIELNRGYSAVCPDVEGMQVVIWWIIKCRSIYKDIKGYKLACIKQY